jgi:hypothetical protein
LAEAQVDLKIDPTEEGILFGILGETATQRWWGSFTGRFGKIAWKVKAGTGEAAGARDSELARLLSSADMDVILMETGRL